MSRQSDLTLSDQFLDRVLDRFPNGVLDFEHDFGKEIFLKTLNRQTEAVQNMFAGETADLVDVNALPKLPPTPTDLVKRSFGSLLLFGFEISSRLLEQQISISISISKEAVLQVYDQLCAEEVENVSKEIPS